MKHFKDKDRKGLWRKQRRGENLGDYLFALVEYNQGKGFISDGPGDMNYTDKRIVAIARGALKYSRLAVSNLAAFVRKYEASEGAREDSQPLR